LHDPGGGRPVRGRGTRGPGDELCGRATGPVPPRRAGGGVASPERVGRGRGTGGVGTGQNRGGGDGGAGPKLAGMYFLGT